jgi:purine nucleoside permease
MISEQRKRGLLVKFLSCLAAALIAAGSAHAAPLAPKVIVITMFKGEAANWLKNEKLDQKLSVPGLSKAFPELACDERGLCLMTTSMGYANAASSISAVVLSDALDLSKTYFLIAGIAGVDPGQGTLGSAHWARYAIDGGLQWEIDGRSLPEGWPTGYFGIFAKKPGEKPKPDYGTEVIQLNAALAEKAYALSKDVELLDSDAAKAYRAHYPAPPANAPPAVSLCDTVSDDTWWHGKAISEAMAAWTKTLTDGAATYCTTQQEDNATLTALQRSAEMGRLDFNRVALLRAASNFDQEYPGETPTDSLAANSGGFVPSLVNAYRVGSKLTEAILSNWDQWKDGPPKG